MTTNQQSSEEASSRRVHYRYATFFAQNFEFEIFALMCLSVIRHLVNRQEKLNRVGWDGEAHLDAASPHVPDDQSTRWKIIIYVICSGCNEYLDDVVGRAKQTRTGRSCLVSRFVDKSGLPFAKTMHSVSSRSTYPITASRAKHADSQSYS